MPHVIEAKPKTSATDALPLIGIYSFVWTDHNFPSWEIYPMSWAFFLLNIIFNWSTQVGGLKKKDISVKNCIPRKAENPTGCCMMDNYFILVNNMYL